MADNTSNEINGILVNNLISILSKKIYTPTDYHGRVKAVKAMQENDVTGLVDSLSDFLVTSAKVNYKVETRNETFNKIMNQWLTKEINAGYKGQVPRGIIALAEEYYKERWKSSSFPILKVAQWKKVKGIKVPVKMFFVDGESVYAEDTGKKIKKIGQQNYFLGKGRNKEQKLDKGVIITKPFARWFDDYPVPYMVKRGIHANFKIIEALKDKQNELLNQIIPYMFLLKKGSEMLSLGKLEKNAGKTYSNTELTNIVTDIKATIADTINSFKKETFVRASQWDEEISHLIPNIKPLFEATLFTSSEKAILGGFGFLDIAESVASNRKESILNPTAFVQEIERGIDDFINHILRELVYQIMEENSAHTKFSSLDVQITHSPVKGFMTDKFRAMIRSMYDRGLLSRETAVEMGVEVPFEAEVARLNREKARGLLTDQKPPKTDGNMDNNQPAPEPSNKPSDNTPDDKKGIEKKNFNKAIVDFEAGLETMVYPTLQSLPANIKAHGLKIRRQWRARWNSAYNFKLGQTNDKKEAETYAFKIANIILPKNK